MLILQGTAIYEPQLLLKIAVAAQKYEILGVGIARETFADNDPYGTFVIAKEDNKSTLIIAEKDIRNNDTLLLQNQRDNTFLPFNTGFYAVSLKHLHNSFPHYASPNKTILPGIDPAPKIGYAATDLLGFSDQCGVLLIDPTQYKVIKSAEDIVELSKTVTTFSLEKYKQ